MTNIAINGFGRIGRMVCRAWLESPYRDKVKLVAINDLVDINACAHLLQYDSVHGKAPFSVTTREQSIIMDSEDVRLTAQPQPADLPWAAMDVDIVLECSGRFTARAGAEGHLQAGAKRVIISAPATDPDITVVVGVNHTAIKTEHRIISNASCTTNCLAPVAKTLHDALGITKGYMTTVHSYTGDQVPVDTGHKDMRRARAAALNIIPTSTGAAKAVGLVLPSLKGLLDGCAVRVPTANVSMVDLTFLASQQTHPDAINEIMKRAAANELKGILEVNEQPLVSQDFNHNPHSSIFDATQTQVVGGDCVRVLAWYDNEWGFSNRMVELAAHLTT